MPVGTYTTLVPTDFSFGVSNLSTRSSLGHKVKILDGTSLNVHFLMSGFRRTLLIIKTVNLSVERNFRDR